MARTSPVLCAVCGAKLPPGLRRCLRCGELMEPELATPSRLQQWLGERRGPIYMAATALSILILGGIAIRQAAVPESSDAAVPAATSSTASKTTVRPAAKLAAPAFAGPSFADSRREGNVAYHNGDFAGAIKQYETAIAAHPRDAESLNNLGQVLVRTNRAKDALPYFERAIFLNRNKWAYHFNLARALGLTDNWRRAVDEYRIAASLFPDDHPTQFNLALALHKLGDEEAAVTEYRKAIDLAPDEPTFHLSLAMSLEKLDRRAEAIQSYERYLQLIPGGSDADLVRQRVQELKAQGQVPVAPASGTGR